MKLLFFYNFQGAHINNDFNHKYFKSYVIQLLTMIYLFFMFLSILKYKLE